MPSAATDLPPPVPPPEPAPSAPLICEQCDSVYRYQPLTRDEVARCERCDVVLYRADRLGLDRWFALTVTAAITFVIANLSPVIEISTQGLHSKATLWQAARALAWGAVAPIAVPTALSVIIVPLLQILLLGWVLGFARAGIRAPGFALAMRTLGALRPWSMIQVCLLGLLVAMVKLSSYLDVTVGAGLWATGVLMVLVTLIASQNLEPLWDRAASLRRLGEPARRATPP